MRDATHGHPPADDVQRYVDAALDPTRDAGLVAHVTTCPTCAAEVERLRAVTAALALASAPPPDLLARIQTRRRANEHVILPTGEWEIPAADGSRGPDGPGTGRPLDVAAALSLGSVPPADLRERIAARRAAGERVTLALPPSGQAARAVHARRSWRRAALPAAVAAAALLAVRALDAPNTPSVAPAPIAEATRARVPVAGPVAAPVPSAPVPSAPVRPTVVAVAPARDALRAIRPAADSTPRDSAARDAAAPDAVPDVVVGATVAARGPAGSDAGLALAVSGAGLDSTQRAALDSVAGAVRDDAARRVVIRHAASSARFAERAAERLLLGGVPEERIVPRRVAAVRAAGLGSGLAIEVVVERVVPPRE